MFLRILSLCGVLLTMSTAFGKDTVFELPLGRPLAIPECKKTNGGYVATPRMVCFERMYGTEQSNTQVKNETVWIEYPFTQAPPLIAGTHITAHIVEGKLEGVGFSTRGLYDQDEVLAALKLKYGEPTSQESSSVRDEAGVPFDALTAEWSSDTLQVTYLSAIRSRDAGMVSIATKIGDVWLKEKLKKFTKRGPSL